MNNRRFISGTTVSEIIAAALLIVTVLILTMPEAAYADESGSKDTTVRFTVYYQEYEFGKEIAEPKTFYGRVGEKPDVKYEYIEGYRPLVRSLSKTLKEEEWENVFTFVYVSLGENDETAPAAVSGAGGDADSEDGQDGEIEDGTVPLSSPEASAESTESGKNADGAASAVEFEEEESRDIDVKGPLAEPGKPYEGRASGGGNTTLIFAAVCLALIAGFAFWRHGKKQEAEG